MRTGLLLVRAEHCIEHGGIPAVTGEPDVGDRDEAQARILDPPLQHLRHDHLDLVGQPDHAWRGHVLLLASRGYERGFSRISYVSMMSLILMSE